MDQAAIPGADVEDRGTSLPWGRRAVLWQREEERKLFTGCTAGPGRGAGISAQASQAGWEGGRLAGGLGGPGTPTVGSPAGSVPQSPGCPGLAVRMQVCLWSLGHSPCAAVLFIPLLTRSLFCPRLPVLHSL